MARKPVPIEQHRRIIELHRSGGTYSAIGKAEGLDWRTIRAHVMQAAENQERQHATAVLERVDADLVREHFAILVRVAGALAHVVESDPLLRLDSEIDIDSITVGWIQNEMFEQEPPVFAAAAPTGAQKESLARKLIAALAQHEPEVHHHLEAWKQVEQLFRSEATQAWEEVSQVAEIKRETLPELRGAFHQALAVQDNSSSGLGLVVQQLSKRQYLNDAWKQLGAARGAYVDAYEDLLLRGRPHGLCRWCPGRDQKEI